MSAPIDEVQRCGFAVHQALKAMHHRDVVATITMALAAMDSVELVASIRNQATERLSDLIASRYADRLIGGAAA